MVQPGMGAIPYEAGVAFRVWAPHASYASVIGEFNEWQPEADPLRSEGNGHWYGEVGHAAAGQGYKFHIRNGEQRFDRIDPRAAQVSNSVGHGVIYDHAAFDWQGDDFTPAPHNELVIYEMHVGSFGADAGGASDLDEARRRLDHLTHLGVTAVELMPVMEFAGDVSWGYNPAHIFAIESTYGGPDALKAFVAEAHRRGIAVLVDVVYNHFGPSDLDIWRFDGWSEGDGGGIYFYNDERANTPWGATRPDYGRPEVRSYLLDNARMWLRDFHMDGLRYDMTPYIYSQDGTERDLGDGWSLMREINDTIRHEHPRAILIAEDLHHNPSITDGGEHGAHFHAQWDAAFVHPVREAIEHEEDSYRNVGEVAEALNHSFGDPFSRVIYTESHDEVANGRSRVPQEISQHDPTGWKAQKLSTVGAALVFTSTGIPLLFQGQEFLQGLWFRDDVPLDWDQVDEHRGILRLYRDLIALRRNLSGVTKGLSGPNTWTYRIDEEYNILAGHRWMDGGPGDDVVVIANLSGEPREGYRLGLPHAGTWRLRLNSDSVDYSEDFGGQWAADLEAHAEEFAGMSASADVSIGPYTVLIYSQDA